MLCPRCGTQWEIPQGSCSHCGLTVHGATLPTPSPFPDALHPGERVRNGRYSLQEQVAQRSWFSGIRETTWMGRDFQEKSEAVLLCEIILPDAQAGARHATLRATTHALISAGNHPMLPALKDVFDDYGRIFFVFEAVTAETLYARLSRLGWPLPESDALEMCGAISAVLEIVARQSPPLVHGCICPEHIYCSSGTARFRLGHFSPLIAHGDIRFLKGVTGGWNSPYRAPEWSRGVIDRRSDLYSLIATTYSAVTGAIPSLSGGDIPPARLLNPALSLAFTAILTKGLHPALDQRYQHPSELYQDVRAITLGASSGNAVTSTPTPALVPSLFPRTHTTHVFGSEGMAPSGSSLPFPIKLDLPEDAMILPSAETLPQMREGNDRLEAVVLLLLVVLGSSVATALGSFHI